MGRNSLITYLHLPIGVSEYPNVQVVFSGDKMYNIAVIGGGVIGVTTAIQIQKDVPTAKVTIFAEKLSPNTTGDISAGFWTPYLLEKTPESDVKYANLSRLNYVVY